MPIYSYHCPSHGEFDELKAIGNRDEQTVCPDCNTLSERYLTAPNLSVMSVSNRTAWERNEKSMHEPRRVQHSHACSHTHSECGSQNELKGAKKSSRPWMLGH